MPFPLLCVENCELCFVLQMILKSSVNSRCHPDLWQSERHEEPDEDIAQPAKKVFDNLQIIFHHSKDFHN